MRKILLATTALVGFVAAGAAQAATSPLNVTVGGSVDFLAGAFHESKASSAAYNNATEGDALAKRVGHDFETLYALDIGVTGKAANGLEYGGNLVLDNMPTLANGFYGEGNGIAVSKADIFLSGAFGKVVLGDTRGATDLTIQAPVVGEGQVLGRYIDFVDTRTFNKLLVDGVDGTDSSTNVTYYTPKVGNEANKVQAGVTFAPSMYNYGSSVVHFKDSSDYRNTIKGAIAYTGSFKPVSLGLSAHVINAASGGSADSLKVRPFTSWGVGAQAAANGFTFGGSYTDLGHFGTVSGETKDQQQYTAGLKYEFNKIGVGVSYAGGEGYYNLPYAAIVGDVSADDLYVKTFNSYGVGGTYTWAPGLTTNVDGVLFGQKTESQIKNDGYVLLVSQKLAF